MSIERRPAGEEKDASPKQAETILELLDEMLSDCPLMGNQKHYHDLEEEWSVYRFSSGVSVLGDGRYLTLASVFFFNKNPGYTGYALYEVEKSLPGENLLLRKTIIGSPAEQIPPLDGESSDEYRLRQQMEDRYGDENLASAADAANLICWLTERAENSAKSK